MMQMTAMFAGILNRAYSTVTNIGAAMWVMDPAVNTATSAIPLPDYLLDAVRSMDGVSYAVPLFMGGALVKLQTAPTRRSTWSVWTIPACSAVPRWNRATSPTSMPTTPSSRCDDGEFYKLRARAIGTTFELNDYRGKIVGIVTRRLERPERRADAVYDLQPRDPIHPVHALHHLLRAGAAEERGRHRRHQGEGRQARLRSLDQGRIQQAASPTTTPTRPASAPTS